jgi:ArsR family transcriptional regulator
MVTKASGVLALDLRPVSRMFKALGDETRLRIVALLTHGELCVCHVEAALGISQPTASRALGVLRSEGIVEASRQGVWVHYKLAAQADPERQMQLRALIKAFARHDVLRRDVEKLVRVRGPEACE